ncbi:MAG: murein biosynthesis integral membrane protein MurJ [Peptococcaceae bacterium]|nr:murein biosynthesis integral membrane protein MurJ [Peptococcaceae bacterium]MBO5429120.1 murein biosynthesis integral membrane protein MurJ [Peptococcaceae bacterium]MBQ6852876.1 murein biosynthesis integral membrane protein MurJ [Peptococcaceae bacterium]
MSEASVPENGQNKKEKPKKKQHSSVLYAAGMLTIMMTISRILGFVRDISVSSMFGISWQADAYTAAFTIPDLIYFALVGGGLSSAFIPVFSSYLATDQDEDAHVMASTILNIVAIASMVLIAIGMVFTPQLIDIMVEFKHENAAEATALTIVLTRLMFAQCFFMCLAGISQGILQCYKEFTVPALGAVVYNIAIIVIGILLAQHIGIAGFTIGVVVGAALNLLLQIRSMRQYGFSYKLTLNLRHPGVKKFFLLFLPVVLGLSMNELNLLVSQRLASGLGGGVVYALKQAQRIMMLPVGIFAAAIGLSVFPTMTSHVARGEMKEYKQNLTMGLRTVIFITLPASVGLIALSHPVVRAMYQQGAVTTVQIELVSVILVYYCIGVVGYGAQQILNRGFYAVQDTKSPVLINVFVLLFNIIISIILVGPFTYRGLAMAYSLSGLLSMLVLGVALRFKIGQYGGKALVKSALQSIIASAVMGVAVYFVANGLEQILDLSSKLMQVLQVGIGITAGVVVYAAMAIVMRMEEAQQVLRIVKRKLRRS